jgi:hypothetical protein
MSEPEDVSPYVSIFAVKLPFLIFSMVARSSSQAKSCKDKGEDTRRIGFVGLVDLFTGQVCE